MDDDFDDPQTTELLRDWGRQAIEGASRLSDQGHPRTKPMFTVPDDLSALHARLDAVDEEIGRQPHRAGPYRILWNWRRAALAAAAMVVIGLGVWWTVADLSFRTSPGTLTRLRMDGAQLSDSMDRFRGATEIIHRTGDRIYVHFAVDQAGYVHIVHLADNEPPSVATEDRGEKVTAPAAVLGPYSLTGPPGPKTLVLVGAANEVPSEHLLRQVVQAWDAIPDRLYTERVQGVLDVLRNDSRFSVQAIPFVQSPAD